ncbi:MAG TPA: PAS domain S-box protein, partial [Anaeromyxobacter sp.]|nr:PAS domain S-box protein [Anaeromyxobacter sp.]
MRRETGARSERELAREWAKARGGHYLLAAVATALAFALKMSFPGYFGPPYILFYPAITISAVLGGLGPGLLSTASSSFLALGWVLPSMSQARHLATVDRVSFGVFASMGIFMSAVAASYRRERERVVRLARERRLRESARVAEDRLRSSEERLRLFVEHTPAAVAMFDREMRYLAVSRRYLGDYRLGDQNLLGRSHYDVFPEIPERWREIHRHCQAGAVETCEEDPFPRGDGTLDWVKWEICPWRDVGGDIGGIVLFSELVTARKRAEEGLAAERERLAVTLQSIGDAVIATDREARVTVFNDVAQRLTGWSAGEAIGRPLSEVFRIVSEDTRQPVENPVERVLREGAIIGLANHTALVARDGTERPIADSGAPIRGADGTVRGVVLVFRDQTEERRAEAELRSSEARLRLALDAAQAGTWEWDLRTNKNTWSDGLWELYGLERDGRDASYQTWRESIHPDDRQRVEQAVEEAARTGAELATEWRVALPDGKTRWLASRGRPIRDAGSAFHRYMGVVFDITDRKQAEQALAESERRFRLALRNSPVTVAMQDRGLRYVWAYNQRTAGPGEVLGHGDADLFSPEEAAHLSAVKRRVLDEGMEIREQLWLTRPTGRIFLDAYLEPVRDAAGQVVGLGVATVNLTSEKLAQAALREREERLAVTLRSIADAVIATDEVGRVTTVNEVAESLTGWPASEAVGRPLGEVFRIIGETSRQPLTNPVDRVLREGAPVGLANGALLVARNGTERPIAERGAPIRDSGGAIRGVVLVFRDETAERAAEQLRRLGEERLASSERRYRLLADHAHDAIWTLELATSRYVYVSPSIQALRGLTVEEALAEPIEQSLTPQSLARFRQVLARIGTPDEEDVHTDVYDVPCKDGTIKHVELTATLVRDLTGRPVEVVGVSRDATARVDAQRALAESEGLYRSLFQLAPSGVVLLDEEGGIVAFNDQACRQLGHTREEFARLSVSDINPAESDPAAVVAHLRKIAESGLDQFEANHRTKSGEIRTVLVSSRPALVEGQRRFLAVWQDITERRRAEEAQRRIEERFRALIERSTDLIVVIDANGHHQFWSQGAVEILGWTPEEVLGQPAIDVIHPEDQGRATEVLKQLLAGRGHSSTDLLRLRHKDGSWRYIETTARDLLGDPAVRGVVVNGRDVTAQRQLEEQFRQAQKLESVGRLAGGVAHDFNNLLTVILSCASSLKDALTGGEAANAEDIHEIDAAARRAAELTGQLLAFARKQIVNPVSLNLGEVVHGSERMLRRLLGEDIDLRVERQPGLWTTIADPGQVTQVIVNLAVNARDAMPSGGVLLIQTMNVAVSAEVAASQPERMVGDWVRLAIRDSGTGMSAEVKAHIFEPFFTTKEQGKGTGLGLATVYGIVKQAGG